MQIQHVHTGRNGKFVAFILMFTLLCTTLVGGFTLLTPLLAHAAGAYGAPGDPNIQYIGRWDTTSSSTTYTSYWGGAYLKTIFTGTTVQIKLGAPTTIGVSIDKGADVYYPNVNGTVNLTPTPLVAGTHQLRVAARGWDDSIAFQGLVLDNGATTVVPTTTSKLIEFVGDSITAGYDDTNAALSDYAWLTGEQLHADHTQIAYPGICLADTNSNCASMNHQFFKLQKTANLTSPNWDFSRYQADAVVINLGTNDYYNGITDGTFQTTYISFIQAIRAKYPHAVLLILRTFGGFKASPTQAAVSTVNAAGDNSVYYIDTTGWLTAADYVSDGIHPSDAGQAKVAQRLAPLLTYNNMPPVGSGWTHCAAENQTCSFTGTATVAYGTNGKFAYGSLTNGTACTNTVFGDPNYGVIKGCFVSTSFAPPTPGVWTGCAFENQTCSFTGTHTVAYGTNGKFTYGSYTNGTSCTNGVFGDPNYGVIKACYYQ